MDELRGAAINEPPGACDDEAVGALRGAMIDAPPGACADELVEALRGAFEHRATWLYLLLDEARKAGADYERIGRGAVFRCGVLAAEGKIKGRADIRDLASFFVPFMPDATRRVFAADAVEMSRERLAVEFHYCPLVHAWKRLGCADAEIALLCDIAMEGDRGIAEACGYDLHIASKIAEGAPLCRLEFRHKG
jgi:hypothetical protein